MGNCNPSCFANEKFISQPKIINVQDIENILVSRNSIKSIKEKSFISYSSRISSLKNMEELTEKIKNENENTTINSTQKKPIQPLQIGKHIKKKSLTSNVPNSPNSLKNYEDLIRSTIGVNELKALPPIYFSNGSVYIGQWKDGKKEGHGVLAWPDGSRYEGAFCNDKAHGCGKLTHAEGDTYEGMWAEDKANGQGIYVYSDGRVYKGSWVNDKQHGRGIEIYPDGTKFQGEFLEGKRNGFGMLCFSNGTVYHGMVKEGEIEGFGVLLCEEKTYEGKWKAGKMNGLGKMIFQDGKILEGFFQEDSLEGIGRLQLKDGRKYLGEFKEGKQDGKGVMILNGDRKFGLWKKGVWQNWCENDEEFWGKCLQLEKEIE